MIELDALTRGLSLLFGDGGAWLVVIPGILIGLIFGAVPGLQISMAMAIFLPMTLYMSFMEAMLFLTAIFTGGSFGGSIPAIVMNIPGTSSAIATTFDGYPMAKKGEHNRALGIALAASCVGVLVGYGLLFLLIKPISLLVLKLGPAEMAVIVIWGLTLIASLSGENIGKGVIAGLFGILIGTIGYSEAGVTRGTFDSVYLLDGIPAIPAMMGMFAASELLRLANVDYLIADQSKRTVQVSAMFAGFRKAFSYPFIVLRGSAIGILIGAIPGVGSSIANLLSYSETKRTSNDPETFGEGNEKGVVASEAANSTSEAGSMATLLALGIPGGGATAVMLAAFTMHNITGGPQFIREQTDVVYAIIFANFGQAALLIVLGLCLVPLLANIVRVPMSYLIPTVLVLAVLGSFGLTGSITGPYTVAAFAVIGWIFKRQGYSVAACVIGILLGGMLEDSFIYTYQISGGQWGYILERPLVIIMLCLMVLPMFTTKIISKLSKSI